jgi:DNA-binding response OmpR family regulator
LSKILLIEDDTDFAKMISDLLSLENHKVEWVSDGKEGYDRLKLYEYDLVVLDWGLPNVSGLEILKDFRGRGGVTPILLLTGKNSVEEKEQGLDSGADDYVTKPFHSKELAARLRALLRRPQTYTGKVLHFADLTLDRDSYRVERDGKELELLPKEFDLLEFLMRNPNKVFSPEALLNRVWPTESDATVDALTTCIKRLRKKIDVSTQSSYIRTVHGVGYRLQVPHGD